MKRLLIISDDYYPSSRATIAITQRFAEGLAAKGYEVFVIAIRERLKEKPDYPKKHNGVNVFDYTDFEKELTQESFQRINKYDEHNRRILKFIQMQKRLLVHTNKKNKLVNAWNKFVENIRSFFRSKLYETKVYDRYLFHRKSIAELFVKKYDIDTLISISLPFSMNEISFEIKKKSPKLKWISISFDPYAFDKIYLKKILKKRYKLENKIYPLCDKIMFLTQFKEDYLNSLFKSKITYFELPNIRQLKYDDSYSSIEFNVTKINIVFLGNLFLVERHPKFLFELIQRLNDDFVFYIIGGLVDIPRTYMDEWVKKLNGKLVYLSRVSQEVAINTMFKADVLVNIGNISSNKCPSKVIEYISTGKPILSISQKENCSSLPYLNKYPSKLIISEKDLNNENIIKEVEDFLYLNRNSKTVDFSMIERIYDDCTINSMIKHFEDTN